MKALLLAGSPRQHGSSLLLGQGLLAGLAERGWETQTLRLTGLLESQEGRARLLLEYSGADLCLLAAPVYVDAPPAAVMRALEFLAGEPESQSRPRRLRFAAVFACGFPEASHADISLEVCRLFARDAGLHWAGGLGVGGAGAIGETLEARGRMTAPLRRALRMAAEALADGQDLPAQARELAARPILPRRLYLLLAELGWLGEAARRKTLFRLHAKPFGTP